MANNPRALPRQNPCKHRNHAARFNSDRQKYLAKPLNPTAIRWSIVGLVALLCVLAVAGLTMMLKRDARMSRVRMAENRRATLPQSTVAIGQPTVSEISPANAPTPAPTMLPLAGPPGPEPFDPIPSADRRTVLRSGRAGVACEECDSHTHDFHQTQVAFVRSPANASRTALREGKLRFHLHLSGNLEDTRFT